MSKAEQRRLWMLNEFALGGYDAEELQAIEPHQTRDDIVPYYCSLIIHYPYNDELCNTLNNLIVERWSESALNYIKKEACAVIGMINAWVKRGSKNSQNKE